MQLIAVPPASPSQSLPGSEAAQTALAGIISVIGDRDFGASALARLNACMPLCWWSVYRIFAASPPTMYTSGSYEVRDGTQEAFDAYRAGLYRRDQTFAAAWEHTARGDMLLTHWDARELPARHREQIYSRHGLRERLSLVCRDHEDGLLAVNLYRNIDQAPFTDQAIDAVRSLAKPLLACVSKHLSLLPAGDQRPASTGLFEHLTPRERQVCERLLQGLTHDGIAADLGVSATTIKTYRDRAFARLGIHHRNELYALALSGCSQSSRATGGQSLEPGPALPARRRKQGLTR